MNPGFLEASGLAPLLLPAPGRRCAPVMRAAAAGTGLVLASI